MSERLEVARELLSDEGVIFISIDDNEQAQLKLLCDEIFGENNFVGMYMWYKSATPPNLSKKIRKNLEYVLCYEKNFNSNKYRGIKSISKSNDPMIKPQNSMKILTFPAGSIIFNGKEGVYKKGTYGTKAYPNKLLTDMVIENSTNKNIVSFENTFIWVQSTLEEQLNSGTNIFLSDKLVFLYKKAQYDNVVPNNIIDKNVNVDTTENAGYELEKILLKKLFDYPKPISLINNAKKPPVMRVRRRKL